MRPDQLALEEDIHALPFRVGARKGKWAFKGIRFPFALFYVAARTVPVGPTGFLLRAECSGYAGTAPTSQLWHGGADAPLSVDQRPRNAAGVMEAFKEWQPCLYHPVDRIALAQHENWRREYPDKIWPAGADITFLLETVYDLLHSSEYVGASVSAEALAVPASFVALDLARTA